MKKIFLALLLCLSLSYSANLTVQAYRDNTLMFEYKYENVKNWKWITDFQGHKFIRVELYGNDFVDLPLNDYEVKILK